MTLPERCINETEKLLTSYAQLPPGLRTPADPLLLQILKNQLLLLDVVQVDYVWRNEDE